MAKYKVSVGFGGHQSGEIIEADPGDPEVAKYIGKYIQAVDEEPVADGSFLTSPRIAGVDDIPEDVAADDDDDDVAFDDDGDGF